MLAEGVDNRFLESSSPHSLGLRNNMTVPSPGFDENPLLINQKRFWGAGIQGYSGMGLFDTGLDFTGWGFGEWFLVAAGTWMAYSTFKQTGRTVRQAGPTLAAAAGRRRKSKAARLRAQAKKLEESGYSFRFF